MRNDDETLEHLQAKRARLREKFGPLFDTVAEILFRHDPMQLSMGFNQDEYYPEVDAILVRLEDLHAPLELRRAVWEVFKDLFGADEDTDTGDPEDLEDNVGEEARFDQIANDIWHAYVNWQQSRQGQASSAGEKSKS
jgi:hypothetical protein